MNLLAFLILYLTTPPPQYITVRPLIRNYAVVNYPSGDIKIIKVD